MVKENSADDDKGFTLHDDAMELAALGTQGKNFLYPYLPLRYVIVYHGVNKLAKLAGISTRTLRYYDEIGLLSPVRMSSKRIRIYGKIEVDRLQQILFYRELGVPLDEIKKITSTKDFDGVTALQSHLTALLAKRKQLDYLIANVEKP
nr:MerR family transcriptional regulator [Paenibacillus popilliae]